MGDVGYWHVYWTKCNRRRMVSAVMLEMADKVLNENTSLYKGESSSRALPSWELV